MKRREKVIVIRNLKRVYFPIENTFLFRLNIGIFKAAIENFVRIGWNFPRVNLAKFPAFLRNEIAYRDKRKPRICLRVL